MLYPKAIVEQGNARVPARPKIQMPPAHQFVSQTIPVQPIYVSQPNLKLLADSCFGRPQRTCQMLLRESIKGFSARHAGKHFETRHFDSPIHTAMTGDSFERMRTQGYLRVRPWQKRRPAWQCAA